MWRSRREGEPAGRAGRREAGGERARRRRRGGRRGRGRVRVRERRRAGEGDPRRERASSVVVTRRQIGGAVPNRATRRDARRRSRRRDATNDRNARDPRVARRERRHHERAGDVPPRRQERHTENVFVGRAGEFVETRMLRIIVSASWLRRLRWLRWLRAPPPPVAVERSAAWTTSRGWAWSARAWPPCGTRPPPRSSPASPTAVTQLEPVQTVQSGSSIEVHRTQMSTSPHARLTQYDWS